MDTLIELSAVGLAYQIRTGVFARFRHQALKDINLSLTRGETLGVLGRNGSGKSSLLLLLAGLIPPTSGSLDCSDDLTRALLTLGLGFRVDLCLLMPGVETLQTRLF